MLKSMPKQLVLVDPEMEQSRTVLVLRDSEQEEQLLQYLQEFPLLKPSPARERGGKPVVVVKVNMDIYEAWLLKGAALPLKVGDVFETAKEASEAIGARGNQLASELARAKRNRKWQATVHGVTFEYVTD